MLTKETVKKIRKYAKQRAGTEPAFSAKNLIKTYSTATLATQKVYDNEMDQYAEAIRKGRVAKGESIIKSILKIDDEEQTTTPTA